RRFLVAAFAVGVLAACSEGASGPSAEQTQAMVATADTWAPSELLRGLEVDDATRGKLQSMFEEMHAAMLDLHGRYEQAAKLEGSARAAAEAELDADLQALHERHWEMW